MGEGRILSTRLIPSGYDHRAAGQRVLEALKAEAGLRPDRPLPLVATGYGRSALPFADRAVTEITCHAAGAHYLNPGVRSVIDIGGQDSKVIAMGEGGRVVDFAMNDKCAAGTGRFLEVMARALEVPIETFGEVAAAADRPAAISSTCTVFAESEVISLISRGVSRENILAGIHEAIAARVFAMAARLGLRPPLMMTGGVARNGGVVRALERRCGHPIEVSPHAQLTGAIGAALVAGRSG